MRKINIAGHKFGRWTAIQEAPSYDKKTFWLCRCDCGQSKVVRFNHLSTGSSKSCGCLIAETGGWQNITHGMSGTTEFKSWTGMKDRCFNKNNHKFPDYGGRGITVCDRWKHSFENFLSDMGMKPKGTSLDRKDNNGNYEPSNCRWATPKEQANNRRKKSKNKVRVK